MEFGVFLVFTLLPVSFDLILKTHSCVECSTQYDRLDAYLTHIITEHSAHDRELIALIKQRNILDLSQLNLPAEGANGNTGSENGGGEEAGSTGITIQSLIDDQEQQSPENEEENADCGEEIDGPGNEMDELDEEADEADQLGELKQSLQEFNDQPIDHNDENGEAEYDDEIDFTD